MTMQIGATFAEADYDQHLARLPGIAACRVFSPTDTLPTWEDTRIRKLTAAGVTPFVSVKGFNPQALRHSLDTLPASIPKVILAHHHEPEGDQAKVSTSTWLARQRQLYEIVVNHPNRPRVDFVGVQTKQWVENANDRSYFGYWSGVSDAFCVDAYHNSWGDPNRYADPMQWCARMLDFAARLDVPLWLPEFGAVSRPGDPTDTGRADWLAGVLTVLSNSGLCELAMWWCAQGTAGQSLPGLGTARNFHLHQRQTDKGMVTLTLPPSETVLKQFIQKGKTL